MKKIRLLTTALMLGLVLTGCETSCDHTNGGDAIARIIDDQHHENGIICFDCGEAVWCGFQEEHCFSNLDGACPCGYVCEHGYGDDYYYEITEDSHTAVFVCDVCHSVIHEETNEHFFREGTCKNCSFEKSTAEEHVFSNGVCTLCGYGSSGGSGDSGGSGSSIYSIQLTVTADEISWIDPYYDSSDPMYGNGENPVEYIIYVDGNRYTSKCSNEGSSIDAGLLTEDLPYGTYTIKAYYEGSVIGTGSYQFGCSHSYGLDAGAQSISETHHIYSAVCTECGEVVESYEEEHYHWNGGDYCFCGYAFVK